MKRGNLISSFICMALSVYVIVQANTFPELGGSQVSGPGFFPKLWAVVLVGLSIILLGTSFYSHKNSQVGLLSPESIKVYICMAALIGYIVLLNSIGFILVTPVFLFGLIRFFGMKSYDKIAVTSIVITLAVYGVFEILLAVPLPAGILG